eukprot:gene16770-16950_t
MAPLVRLFRHGDGGLASFMGNNNPYNMGIGTNDISPGSVDMALSLADVRGRPPGRAPHIGFERCVSKAGLVLLNVKPSLYDLPSFMRSEEPGINILDFEWSSGRQRIVSRSDAVIQLADHSWLQIKDVDSNQPIVKRHNKDKNGYIEVELEKTIYDLTYHHKRQLYLAPEEGDFRGHDTFTLSKSSMGAIRFIFSNTMNVYDSDRMIDLLKPLGYELTEEPSEADIAILNTCHIREKAEQKVYSDLGLKRIRYTTSHPRDVDQDLIDAHRDIPQLMPFIHLPVQSGSDRILEAMNHADHKATLALIEEVKFGQAYSFKYSVRPGTPAGAMELQVEEKVKSMRLHELQHLLAKLEGQMLGKTPYMQSVPMMIPERLFGKIVDVKIEDGYAGSLAGSILVGPQDRYLLQLEQRLGVTLALRGNRVAISGNEPEVTFAKNALQHLYNELSKGHIVEMSEIDTAIMLATTKSSIPNGDVHPQEHEADYIKAMQNNDMVFGIGPAGEHLGFLPGDMKEKVDPYLRPLYDALNDMLPPDQVLKLLSNGEIEVAPLAFMRGRTLSNAFVILDEAQNTTVMQMKMFLTRLGSHSRMVINGDMTQIDLPGGVTSALETVLKEAEQQKKRFLDHITHLIVHGTLHLLGYDHVEDTQADAMEALELLGNVLNLRDLTAYDVMIPRADIISAPITITATELVAQFVKTGVTRLPIYRENLDHVVGMMRETGSKMAIVVDEYGGVDGLVTFASLIEEIIGDIQDAHDQAPTSHVVVRADGAVVADARTTLEELEEALSKKLPLNEHDEEDIDTLGGLVAFLAGRVPIRGELVTHPSGIEFEVLDADPRRVKRSLPDVRDGLKPVHRRLIYAMQQLKLNPNSGFKKCARVVGDVMGKFHPHGDSAIYGALVRLAQNFSVRYPLIEGQGNFGNIDGDGAAAMRYTEARLSDVAISLMEGLEENAVDFRPTYDGEGEEPIVFPSAFPNLLANGATGIAVGMATSIPPHNLDEICKALIHLIDHPESTVRDLMSFIPAPDFPTGGVANWQVEDQKGGLYRIVVTHIPYQIEKSKLIEKIATLLNDKKLPLLDDVLDESTDEIRLVLQPKSRNVDAAVLMETLFRATDLEQIAERLEILGGYLIAYLNLDEVIRIIRDEDDPKAVMMEKFGLTANQVEAILNMRLRSLRKLQEIEIRKEYDTLEKERKSLEKLLASPKLQWQKIGFELESLRKKFGQDTALGARRTMLAKAPESIDIPSMDAIEKEDVTVILSAKNWIRAIKGHQVTDLKYKEGDAERFVLTAQTTDKLLLFATNGRFYTLGIDKLPRTRGHGEPLRLLVDLENTEDILSAFVISPEAQAQFLLTATDGRGFVVNAKDALAQTKNGKQVLVLGDGEKAQACIPITGDHIAIIGENRKLLVFPIQEIPTMTKGRGVTLQKYRDGKMSDLTIFSLSNGLTWTRAGKTITEKDLRTWQGRRAGSGRLAPIGFPRTNKFG